MAITLENVGIAVRDLDETVGIEHIKQVFAIARPQRGSTKLSTLAQPVAVVTSGMEMQSTGQAGTHSSQPVHCEATTTCMAFGAPTMQSAGQALMHRVQPMHQASSMTATPRKRCGACLSAASR